jgi:hypothetical protein
MYFSQNMIKMLAVSGQTYPPLIFQDIPNTCARNRSRLAWPRTYTNTISHIQKIHVCLLYLAPSRRPSRITARHQCPSLLLQPLDWGSLSLFLETFPVLLWRYSPNHGFHLVMSMYQHQRQYRYRVVVDVYTFSRYVFVLVPSRSCCIMGVSCAMTRVFCSRPSRSWSQHGMHFSGLVAPVLFHSCSLLLDLIIASTFSSFLSLVAVFICRAIRLQGDVQ